MDICRFYPVGVFQRTAVVLDGDPLLTFGTPAGRNAMTVRAFGKWAEEDPFYGDSVPGSGCTVFSPPLPVRGPEASPFCSSLIPQYALLTASVMRSWTINAVRPSDSATGRKTPSGCGRDSRTASLRERTRLLNLRLELAEQTGLFSGLSSKLPFQHVEQRGQFAGGMSCSLGSRCRGRGGRERLQQLHVILPRQTAQGVEQSAHRILSPEAAGPGDR